MRRPSSCSPASICSSVAGPQTDEIEVTLLGPGFGESIAVHIGEGDWILVDSCRDPVTKRVPVLDYLDSIEVSSSSQVKQVVVTHWHDDHLRGLGELVDRCESAVLVHSPALDDKSMRALVALDDPESGGLGMGLRELHRAVRTLSSRRHADMNREVRKLALAGTPLVGPSHAPRVRALSPSSEAVLTCLKYISTISQVGVDRRRVRRPNANHASVVLWIHACGQSVLLGADLQRHVDTQQGWKHIVRDDIVRPSVVADLVKVPHHGARSGHDDEMWTELVKSGAVSLICPWLLGGRRLPAERDVARICALSGSAYVAASMEIARTASALPGAISEAVFPSTGRITARRAPDEQAWRVEVQAPAQLLCPSD